MPDQLELTLPRQVGLVLQPGFAITSLSAIADTFSLANSLSGTGLYAPTIYAVDEQPVTSAEGVTVNPDHSPRPGQRPHFVFVVSAQTFQREILLIDWLSGQLARGIRIFHAPVGAVAGVTHIDALLAAETANGDEMSPASQLSARSLLIEQICDLIGTEHGAQLSRRVRKAQLMQGQLSPDDARAMAQIAEIGAQTPRLATAIRLMQANVETPLKLPEIARRIGLSMRQLERLSQEHLQSSPHAYYLRIRLTHADFLIRDSQCSLEQVAKAIGFRSLGYFSRRYREQFGHRPRRAQTTRPMA